MTILVGYTPASGCSGSATPGARSLMAWFLDTYPDGRNDGIYNCLSGDTLVLTPRGDVPIRDMVGTDATILTWAPSTTGPGRPLWVTAPVRSYGTQPLHDVVLTNGVDSKTVRATAGHRWVTRYRRSGVDGGGLGHVERTTDALVKGSVIPSVLPSSSASHIRHMGAGVGHGLVYGDGTIDSTGGSRIVLCGHKNAPLAVYLPNAPTSTYVADNGEPMQTITGLSRTWKALPSLAESTAYLYGFLAGWFAADGRVGSAGTAQLYCANADALEQARLIARRIGISTYPIRDAKSGGNEINGQWIEPGIMHSLTFVGEHLDSSFFLIPEHRERWNARGSKRRSDWRVESVSGPLAVETVYCAEVEGTETFVLADGVLTGNCRSTRGGTTYSIHAEGRAADLGTPMAAPPSWADDLAQQLVDNSAELGVQCVIWDRRIWSGARPSEGWRVYSGVDAHRTHLHVELTRAAGRDLTVATISDVLAPTPAPKPAPAPKGPTDMAHTVSYAGTVWLIDAGTRRKVPDPDFLDPLRAAGILDLTDKVKDVKKYLGWWPYATAGDDQAAAILAAVTAAQAAGGTPEQIAKAVVAEIAS